MLVFSLFIDLAHDVDSYCLPYSLDYYIGTPEYGSRQNDKFAQQICVHRHSSPIELAVVSTLTPSPPESLSPRISSHYSHPRFSKSNPFSSAVSSSCNERLRVCSTSSFHDPCCISSVRSRNNEFLEHDTQRHRRLHRQDREIMLQHEFRGH